MDLVKGQPGSSGKIRVAVVGVPLDVDVVRSMLGGDDRFDLVGTGVNGREAIQIASRLRPDVMILEFQLPLLSGLEAASRIHRAYPEISILILSDGESLEVVKRALRMGVHDLLLKTAPREEITSAILSARKTELAGPSKRYASMWSFVGGKASSGCTTLAVNVAYDLAMLGYKTLLVDFDPRAGDCGFYLNLDPLPQSGNLLFNLGTVPELTQQDLRSSVRSYAKGLENLQPLHLLESALTPIPPAPVSPERFSVFLDLVAAEYDYIIMDLPAAWVYDELSLLLVDASERVFVVANSDLSSLKAATLVMCTFFRIGVSMDKLEILLNCLFSHPGFDAEAWLTRSIPSIARILKVPKSEGCDLAIQNGTPLIAVNPQEPLSLFVRGLVERTLGRPADRRTAVEEPKSVLSRLMGLLKA